MRRILPCALIALLGSPALARPKAPRCQAMTPALEKKIAAYDAFSTRSFEDALARAHLTSAAPALRTLSPGDPQLKDVAERATFTFGTGASASTAIRWLDGDAYGRPGAEFVADARGVIHPLTRREREIASLSPTICGCAPITHGGAVPPRVVFIYVLPAGARYDATPIEVAYDARRAHLRYRNLVHGEDVICPQPP